MTSKNRPPRAKPAKLKGINAITVKGYKSIYDEAKVEIRPLTLLAGANSSGKSSLMQALLVLKQTLESPYDPGPLRLLGPNVQITSADQILSRLKGKPRANKFEIGLTAMLSDDHFRTIKTAFKQVPGKGFEIDEMSGKDNLWEEESFVFRPAMSHEEIGAAIPEHGWPRDKSFYVDIRVQNAKWKITRDYCFLCVELSQIKGKFKNTVFESFTPAKGLKRFIRSIIHVPGLRGNPERIYPIAAIGQTFIGAFQHYTASIIAHWQTDDDRRIKKLNKHLDTLGLTRTVVAKPLDDSQIELRVGRLPHGSKRDDKDLVNIADVGFGLSQCLPVLVALLVAEPGQLVYIEQPELHLHPRAQKALADILAEAALRGVRVVAETHSSILLLGVQTLVAEGKLPAELVKLHWFERGDDGATTVTSADLDRNGAFGDWPEDFDEVELEAEGRYLDAGERQ